MNALRACVADAEGDTKMNPVAAQRLKDMLAFTEQVSGWYAQMQRLPKSKLLALIRLGVKIVNFIPGGKTR